MSAIGSRTRHGVFALAMAAALGFGTAQAFAAPGAAAGPVCTNPQCDRECRLQGYDGGVCIRGSGCACWIQ
ncbi:MAG TPA: hypothetical protein VFY65_05295 [Longimicrobium sp.]|nr:hypothetical protein [Longimicrobium sp.]